MAVFREIQPASGQSNEQRKLTVKEPVSIVKKDAYTISCDECGCQYEGDQFSMWGDQDHAIEDAVNSEWVCDHPDRPDKHYCPACAEVDKDGNLLFLKP